MKMEIMDLRLSIIYRVLKELSERNQLLISEAIAIAGSTIFYQRYLPYLEERGYITSEKRREGRRTIRLIKITNKGRRLLELLEEIKKLDSS